MTIENSEAGDEARKAAELAASSIKRFLDAQSKRDQTQPTKAQEYDLNLAGEAAGSAAELAAINIRRFIEMQSIHHNSLIMRAHQTTEVKER